MLMPGIEMIRRGNVLILILLIYNGINFRIGSELNRIDNSRDKHDREEYGDDDNI